MVEMKRLGEGDFDELLEMLNYTFSTHYGRDMDFLNEQPNMWVKNDEHMSRHFGIFDGGRLASVVGIYPLPAVINGTEVLFATTGNVATHPSFVGKGYFTRLFTRVMEELDVIDADAARLGGARQRYARFGFEPCGTLHKFSITEKNRTSLGKDVSDIKFREVTEDSLSALEFINSLSRKAKMYIKREGCAHTFRNLCSKHASPYIAERGGEPVGYLSAYSDNQFVGRSTNGRHIAEIRATSPEALLDISLAWQERVGQTIDIPIAPFMTRELRLFSSVAQDYTTVTPSHFRFRRFERIADALMRVKLGYTDCYDGEGVIEIEDYGRLCFYNRGGTAGCERTNLPPSVTLSRNDAQRLIFGALAPDAVCDLPKPLNSFLPLPLTWNTNDYT